MALAWSPACARVTVGLTAGLPPLPLGSEAIDREFPNRHADLTMPTVLSDAVCRLPFAA